MAGWYVTSGGYEHRESRSEACESMGFTLAMDDLDCSPFGAGSAFAGRCADGAAFWRGVESGISYKERA